MKRILISLLFVVFGATTIFAQVTSNIGVGVGYLSGFKDYAGLTPRFQLNVALRGTAWTFSPSVNATFAIDPDDFAYQIYAPLQMGYKAYLGNRTFLFPKLGFAFGYHAEDACDCYGAIVAPAASLDLEIGHFVVGANFFYSLTHASVDESDYAPYGAFLSLGYKF